MTLHKKYEKSTPFQCLENKHCLIQMSIQIQGHLTTVQAYRVKPQLRLYFLKNHSGHYDKLNELKAVYNILRLLIYSQLIQL